MDIKDLQDKIQQAELDLTLRATFDTRPLTALKAKLAAACRATPETRMTNICTPSMAAAGARVLHDWRKSVNMDLSWPKKIAVKVYLAMEIARIAGEVEKLLDATTRRAAANTPWNTPRNPED